MNIDLILIKLFFNKDIYNKYNNIINIDFYRNNNKELFKIFLSLFNYHKQSTEEVVSLDNFSLFFFTQYPLLRVTAEGEIINTLLHKISALVVDEKLSLSYLNEHLKNVTATTLAIKSLEVSQGKEDFAVLKDILDSVQFAQEEPTDALFVTDDLEILVNKNIASEGLRWRTISLNKSLGSLRKGDFGFIFARPETGKTTFLASEVTFMAEQAKEKGMGGVLWINNEEQGSKVMLRNFQALFEVTTKDLYTNLDYFKEEFNSRLGGFLKIYDKAKVTKNDVEEVCKQINPSLIIIDQIDKIAWQDSERHDLKMKAIYQWARELAKNYGAVIAVCQAGGTGEGKKYLDMNDVDSSHTAKQGEADFMIGIGKTHNDAEQFVRYISISKNKLEGDIDTDNSMRHGKFPVIIKPEVARYADSIDWGVK